MAAENGSKQVSTMLKQGFIADSTLSFSPSRTTTMEIYKVRSPSSSPSKTIFSTPPSSNHSLNQTQYQNRPSHNSTLFHMMSEEQQRESKLSDDSHRKSQLRVSKVLSEAPFQNPTNSGRGSSDVRLTVVSRDGFSVSMDVHKSVLVEKSRFFADKLSQNHGVSHSVEICDCEDVEVYVETLVLMYCEDLKRRLIGEDVSKILGLLKVSAEIMFDAGVFSCLEFLEAVPWREDEEEKILSHLSQLQLNNSVSEVLQRVTSEPSNSTTTDDIVVGLLTGLLQAKDDKARREMKRLLSRLLREDVYDSERLDVFKHTLYHLCHQCLSSLVMCLSEAPCVEENKRDRGVLMSEIAREADNIQWIIEILIDKKVGDDFVKVWADQKELANLHSRIPTVYRHEVSKITAQLCIAIGRGHILVPKETRFSLLSTWLEALYGDFGWMRRVGQTVDKKLVEDGLGQTILTLPMPQQRIILMNWFDRFINEGDDCPNIQKAFEIWWRRAFGKEYIAEQDISRLQITVCEFPN